MTRTIRTTTGDAHRPCDPVSYCRDEFGEPEEHRHEYRRDLADWWCQDCQTVTDYCQRTTGRG